MRTCEAKGSALPWSSNRANKSAPPLRLTKMQLRNVAHIGDYQELAAAICSHCIGFAPRFSRNSVARLPDSYAQQKSHCPNGQWLVFGKGGASYYYC
jgi:hypothetical protein